MSSSRSFQLFLASSALWTSLHEANEAFPGLKVKTRSEGILAAGINPHGKDSFMGAGSFPAGVGFAGADPVGTYGAPAIIVQTSLVPLWDLATRSVPRNAATNLVKTIHWVDQAVALALGVSIGGVASQPGLGHRLRQIKRNTPAKIQIEVEDTVRLTLKDLLDRGDITVTDIAANTNVRSQIIVAVSYINLRKTPLLPDNIAVAF